MSAFQGFVCIFSWSIVCITIGIVAGVSAGESIADERWQKEAVKAGHAEYITSEDGEPIWNWRPRCEP